MTNLIYFSTGKEDEVYDLPLWAELAKAAGHELSAASKKAEPRP